MTVVCTDRVERRRRSCCIVLLRRVFLSGTLIGAVETVKYVFMPGVRREKKPFRRLSVTRFYEKCVRQQNILRIFQ